jgi:segregation and condensation protein A
MDLVEAGVHKSAVIGWFLATLELTRHHGAMIEEDEGGDIVIVKTDQYSESLSVNEIDNYGADGIIATNLPSQPR